MNRVSSCLFMLVLSIAPWRIFTGVAAAGLQDGFPLAIGNGPARFHWNTASTAVLLQFNGPIASAIEVARLARGVDDRAWHLAETVHATVADGRAHLTGPIGVETLLLDSRNGTPWIHPGWSVSMAAAVRYLHHQNRLAKNSPRHFCRSARSAGVGVL